jgi:hypothetical protein
MNILHLECVVKYSMNMVIMFIQLQIMYSIVYLWQLLSIIRYTYLLYYIHVYFEIFCAHGGIPKLRLYRNIHSPSIVNAINRIVVNLKTDHIIDDSFVHQVLFIYTRCYIYSFQLMYNVPVNRSLQR